MSVIDAWQRPTRAALGALSVLFAFTVTACGNADTGSAASAGVSTTEHNDADVAFASDMIQHHAQALFMIDLTVGRTMDEGAQRLVEDIRAAQGPEIETMTDWLTDWDEEIPETMRDHVNAEEPLEGMDHGDSEMPGMVSAEDLTALERAQDDEFQQMWLEMMIEHHQGAVMMAEDQIDDGRYKPAVDMAAEIVVSQTEEMETMRDILAE